MANLTRTRVLARSLAPGAKAWTALLLAPNLGSALGGLIGTALGVKDTLLIAQSTTVDDVLRAVGLVGGLVVAGWLLLREDAPAFHLDVTDEPGFSFPGRLLGGIMLIAAPILLVAGEVLRLTYHYYFPQQLQAFAERPGLMTASYSLYTLGLVLLIPAFLALASLIGRRKRGWALWGAALGVVGVAVRVFHEGINHLAFRLVEVQGLEAATRAVRESYSDWYMLYPLTFTDNLGWPVLAIGAYLFRTLGWLPAAMVAAMVGHSSGVLKGSDLGLVAYAVALCVAFVPLGIAMLRTAERPSRRATYAAVAVLVGLAAIYTYQLR